MASALAAPSFAQGEGQGQGQPPFMVRIRPTNRGDSSETSAYRSFMVALPVYSVGRDMVLRTELNLYGRASLALEGNYQRPGEDMTNKEKKQTGQSMTTDARSGALLLNRYSRPYLMAGFYYGLGFGYRQEDVDWRMPANATATGAALTQSGQVAHEATARGATGHARVGYRYTGSEVPLLIGIYAGVRHFQAVIDDAKDTQGTGRTKDNTAITPMTEAEKEHLLRRLQTAPEAGLEVGFAF